MTAKHSLDYDQRGQRETDGCRGEAVFAKCMDHERLEIDQPNAGESHRDGDDSENALASSEAARSQDG
jgi:hypothetical protein